MSPLEKAAHALGRLIGVGAFVGAAIGAGVVAFKLLSRFLL